MMTTLSTTLAPHWTNVEPSSIDDDSIDNSRSSLDEFRPMRSRLALMTIVESECAFNYVKCRQTQQHTEISQRRKTAVSTEKTAVFVKNAYVKL